MLNDIYHALDPVAFSIGPFAFRWYGLGYLLGFMLAAILAYRIAKRWNIKFTVDGLLILIICCVIGTVVGGRLGYILFYGEGYYFQHPDQILVFSGMSFHGGLIGFAIGAIIASRINKMPIATVADLCGITATIGLGLVRVANFINGELWGKPTDLPWGVVFEGAGPSPMHPSQLYEAFLEGAVLLLILYILSRKKPPLPRGSYFGIFLIGYAVFRIAVEFVRLPDAHIGYLLGTDFITMGMVLSLPMIAVGAGFLIYAARTKHPQAGMEFLEAGEADGAQADSGDGNGTDADSDPDAEADAGANSGTSADASKPANKTAGKTAGIGNNKTAGIGDNRTDGRANKRTDGRDNRTPRKKSAESEDEVYEKILANYEKSHPNDKPAEESDGIIGGDKK